MRDFSILSLRETPRASANKPQTRGNQTPCRRKRHPMSGHLPHPLPMCRILDIPIADHHSDGHTNKGPLPFGHMYGNRGRTKIQNIDRQMRGLDRWKSKINIAIKENIQPRHMMAVGGGIRKRARLRYADKSSNRPFQRWEIQRRNHHR